MHRFFITPDQRRGQIVRFDDAQTHQMRRVLRLRPGDRVLALDGQGWQYEVALEEVSNSRVTGLVAAQAAATGEPRVRLTLFQSLLQRDKFEWVLQKGTEIGVTAFAPVITRRSLVRDAGDVGENKLERWRRIIKEAAEQSGRGALPTIGPAVPLAVALSGLFSPPEQEGSGSLPLRGRVRERVFRQPPTQHVERNRRHRRPRRPIAKQPPIGRDGHVVALGKVVELVERESPVVDHRPQ